MSFPFFSYAGSVLRFLMRAAPYTRVESGGKQFLLNYAREHNGSFSDKLIKEASKRIAIQQLFINDTIALLYGRTTNEPEQHLNRLYFVLSSVYDDLMDELGVDLNDLHAMVYHPESFRSNRFYEQALVDTHQQLLEAVRFQDEYKQVVNAIHRAQMDSLKQKNGGLGFDALVDIARRKGGGSLLMCRHYIDLPKGEVLDACWFELGGVIQLSNDMFDVYKDHQEGIDTFVSRADSCAAVRKAFEDQVKRLIQAFALLDADESKKRACFVVLSLIPALGYVALRQVESVCDRDGRLPDLKKVERKRLITDMEKWGNIRYWLESSYLLSAQFNR
ncbi:MAG: hypothetical protein FJX83_06965 [Bacteroidetes bacterium]|nr:hypothetical protein [Bacteroidota bacterium]